MTQDSLEHLNSKIERMSKGQRSMYLAQKGIDLKSIKFTKDQPSDLFAIITEMTNDLDNFKD
jgi:hypothetical protein